MGTWRSASAWRSPPFFLPCLGAGSGGTVAGATATVVGGGAVTGVVGGGAAGPVGPVETYQLRPLLPPVSQPSNNSNATPATAMTTHGGSRCDAAASTTGSIGIASVTSAATGSTI